jgi:hypothetical protein
VPTLIRIDRYSEAIKLDRAAMKIRNELRRGHPRSHVIQVEKRRVRRAMERI